MSQSRARAHPKKRAPMWPAPVSGPSWTTALATARPQPITTVTPKTAHHGMNRGRNARRMRTAMGNSTNPRAQMNSRMVFFMRLHVDVSEKSPRSLHPNSKPLSRRPGASGHRFLPRGVVIIRPDLRVLSNSLIAPSASRHLRVSLFLFIGTQNSPCGSGSTPVQSRLNTP